LKRDQVPPDECANCGAAIPRGAKACPECGADERTGWREGADSIYDGLDLPEEAFDDDESTRAKSDARRGQERGVNGIAWYWWCIGVVLIFVLLLRFL
jgi:hypothetical protein